jgi:hypothetical protein
MAIMSSAIIEETCRCSSNETGRRCTTGSRRPGAPSAVPGGRRRTSGPSSRRDFGVLRRLECYPQLSVSCLARGVSGGQTILSFRRSGLLGGERGEKLGEDDGPPVARSERWRLAG